jgi:hypothetical protein
MGAMCGMLIEVWVNYFRLSPGYLAHLRRKAHDWKKDYSGLTRSNFVSLNREYNNVRQVESPEQEVLREVSRN